MRACVREGWVLGLDSKRFLGRKVKGITSVCVYFAVQAAPAGQMMMMMIVHLLDVRM